MQPLYPIHVVLLKKARTVCISNTGSGPYFQTATLLVKFNGMNLLEMNNGHLCPVCSTEADILKL